MPKARVGTGRGVLLYSARRGLHDRAMRMPCAPLVGGNIDPIVLSPGGWCIEIYGHGAGVDALVSGMNVKCNGADRVRRP